MNKNLKLSFILTFIMSAIVISWSTLYSFFGGVGINFVALVCITCTFLMLILSDESLKSRARDLFIIVCIFTCLEFVVFLNIEFGFTSSYKVMKIYQNVLILLAIATVAYTLFRLICEIKQKRVHFIEILLGNEERVKKEKKAKELSNGTLSEKPNNTSINDIENSENTQSDSTSIFEETKENDEE